MCISVKEIPINDIAVKVTIDKVYSDSGNGWEYYV